MSAVDERREERERMVERIEQSASSAWPISKRVLDAMAEVPRHLFLPAELAHLAYESMALPIGCGQTISQPEVVAVMIELADPQPEDVVLDVGTGSGYQAAVLSRLAGQVYGIERVRELVERAVDCLERLGISNVEVRCGDGFLGWPEHAPYAAILIAAATPEVPEPLLDQLAVGGRLVAPLGRPGWQQLVRLVRESEVAVKREEVMPVSFVPFLRGLDDG